MTNRRRSRPTPQRRGSSWRLPALTLLAAAGLLGCAGEPTGPRVASQMAFEVQPGNAYIGQTLTPEIQVGLRTHDGELATGYRGRVTLAIGLNPGDATLAGTLTREVAGGIASFDDLSLDRPGHSYTLVARAESLQIESEPFYILRPSIYVVSGATNVVAVIDPEQYTTIATIPVGDGPGDIEIAPDGALAYVANCRDSTISVIDTDDNAVLATIAAGETPCELEITPDGSSVWVANFDGLRISVIDVDTRAVVNEIRGVNYPRGLALTPDGARAYALDGGRVDVIPTSYTAVWDTINLTGFAYSIDCTPDGERLYVTQGDGMVSVIATATNEIVASIRAGRWPAPVAVTPDGGFAYVGNGRDGTVSVISTESDTVERTVNSGGEASDIAFSGEGALAYLTVADRNFIRVIATATHTILGTFPTLDAPAPVALAVMPAPLPKGDPQAP